MGSRRGIRFLAELEVDDQYTVIGCNEAVEAAAILQVGALRPRQKSHERNFASGARAEEGAQFRRADRRERLRGERRARGFGKRAAPSVEVGRRRTRAALWREVGQHLEQSVRNPPLERPFRVAPADAAGARRVEGRGHGLGRGLGHEPARQGVDTASERRFAAILRAQPLAEAQDLRTAAERGRRYNERVATKQTRRSRAQVARFAEGLDVVEPGVVQFHRWRPEPGVNVDDYEVSGWAVVGRKP